MKNQITSEQDLRKIERFNQAGDNDFLGASTIARALNMSYRTFLRYTKIAGINCIQDQNRTLYKKGDVIDIREKVASV